MLSTLCIWLFVLHAALLSASGAQLKHNQQHVLSINSNNDSSSNIPIQSESEDQGSHRSMYLVDTMNFASLLEVKSTSESLLNATASASSSLSTHTKKLLKHHHKHHKHHHKRHHTQSSLMQMQTQTQTSVNAEVESEAELRASVILDILTTANASLLENLQTNVTVGFLTVVDADSKDNFNDFKFEIAEGAEYFKVGGADGNELIALFSADYENKKEYTVKVRCVDTSHQDGDSNELVEEFIIGVIDENDVAPYDIVFDHDAFVETTKSGDVIATLSFKDDDTVETHYTLALSGEHSGYFTLTGDGGKTGELKLVNALDYDTAVDHVYALSISVDDHRTGADPSTQSFTFAVTDANDIAPSACHWESVPFAEGVSGVTVIAGVFSYEDADTSKDDNTLTFTDASGKFHFDPVTGTINVVSSVDFETDSSYPVQIKVNDHANTELVCDFSISPDDVNDNAPEAFVISEGTLEISAKTIEVDLAENTAVGSVVYRLDFSDEDTQSSGQVFTCHVDDETNTFGLDKTESVSDSFFELMLEGEVDYETTKDYSFDMTVSDGSYTEVFRVSVKVKDENDVAPSDITLSAYAVAETAAVGTEAATITFDDVDTVGDYTCTIPSTDPFTISAADDNTFILLTAEDFNHHVSSSYTISITCSDGVHSETDTAVITIEDKNDNAPSALALSSEDIDENKAVGSTVGLLSFEDQDGETPNEFTFTVTNVDIVGDDTVFFTVGEITATSGSHTFTAPLLSAQEFDFEEKSLYPINIKISDGKHFHDQEFTVTVTDLNDNEMGEVSVTQNEAAAVSVVSE